MTKWAGAGAAARPAVPFLPRREMRPVVSRRPLACRASSLPGSSPEGWICLGRSRDFPVGRPRLAPFRTLPFVVVRQKGRGLCVHSDACIHRGAPLHLGRLGPDGCLECPYHGWRYGPDGSIEVPGRGVMYPDSILWQVRERDDLVWVAPDLLTRSEPPAVPLLGAEGTRAVRGSYDLAVPAAQLLENGFDITHASWVHAQGGAFGHLRELPTNVVEEETPTGNLRVSFDYRPDPRSLTSRLFGIRTVRNVHEVILPYTTWSEVSFRGGRLVTFVTLTPLEKSRTRLLATFVRDFATSPLLDPLVLAMGSYIVGQDRALLERVYPAASRSREAHGPFDGLAETYRSRLRRMLFK